MIPRAMQGQKRVWGELQEYDPFAGLCGTGVVWKLTEDGKNVVKASYSRYYENIDDDHRRRLIASIDVNGEILLRRERPLLCGRP